MTGSVGRSFRVGVVGDVKLYGKLPAGRFRALRGGGQHLGYHRRIGGSLLGYFEAAREKGPARHIYRCGRRRVGQM